MKSSHRLVLVLITLAIIHIVQAQQGFISLDCGRPANETSPYKLKNSELLFSSDEKFIQSGETGQTRDIPEEYNTEQFETLRYFPKGLRNCYNLNVEKGQIYLIATYFIYGNYDGLDIKPVFELHLGPNLWDTIDLEAEVNGTRREIIHNATSNTLQICLVKNGRTTPLISAIELRPVGQGSYITESGSMSLHFRRYFNNSSSELRYPFDVYDRVWSSRINKTWTQISTTSEVGNADVYKAPKEALATAAIPTNPSEPLTITWTNSDDPTAQYYFYSHYAEIQELEANDTREFNMVWNGQVIPTDPINPQKLAITTRYISSPRTCNRGECSFQLIRTNRSTLPPLLNAIQVYTVIQFPQSETDENDVNAIKDIASTYGLSRINWQGDPCFPPQLRWDALNCSNSEVSIPPRITSLDLSSSGLTGNIAAVIQNLTLLEKLDLSNNNLTGGVPEFLGNMKSLSLINLSGNNLNGTIPQALQNKGLQLLVEGNPRLCLSESCRKSPKKKVLLPIVASVASAAIIIIVLIIFLVLRKKKWRIVDGLHLPLRKSTMKETFANKNSRRFTYSEVIQMTNNFQRVLGKGGFGMVYHGTVNGSQQVAVKILSQSSNQGYKEFKSEVDLLLRVHHINLVSLVGYCYEGDHLALIYEFLPNGDLKQHLTGKGGKSIINWSNRLQIALEAAQGLEYLHIGCTPPMVHRDVKTANILLGENFNAKLADFGLTRSFQGEGESQQSSMIAGTLGYLDPEYGNLCRLSEKSDVYSFGIVLLEIITNQPVINQSSEYSYITQWVGFKLNCGDITEIMDPNLHKDYNLNSAWRALELAMSCANQSSSKRPSMSEVINELKECIVCEYSGNRGLQPEEMNVNLDTSVVPIAR